jgi:DNA-binding response OmpR family regulator
MSTKKPAGREPAAPTVLLVEDDPKIVSFLAKGFRREGFRLDCVSTGAEALARLEDGGIDVQLLDLGLPDRDGLEVLRKMRDRGMDVPVIVVTGRTDPRDRTIALSLGVRAYLTKPFPWTDLLAEVRAAVGHSPSSEAKDARTTPDRG